MDYNTVFRLMELACTGRGPAPSPSGGGPAPSTTSDQTAQDPPDEDDGRPPPYLILIILNYTVPPFIRPLWRAARLRVCADGGSNRLFEALTEDERERFLPDFIKGDLDSIRPEVATFYSNRGVPVIHDTDQDSTDLGKAMALLEELRPKRFPNERALVAVVGALGGRLDHEMSNLNMGYVMRTSGTPLVFMSPVSIATVLPEGRHVVQWRREFEGPTCGLVPLGCRCRHIRTKGLRWNLEGDRSMEFGGLVSTSNELVDSTVVIEISDPILWTTVLNAATLTNMI